MYFLCNSLMNFLFHIFRNDKLLFDHLIWNKYHIAYKAFRADIDFMLKIHINPHKLSNGSMTSCYCSFLLYQILWYEQFLVWKNVFISCFIMQILLTHFMHSNNASFQLFGFTYRTIILWTKYKKNRSLHVTFHINPVSSPSKLI